MRRELSVRVVMFYHEQKNVRVVAHEDYFSASGGANKFDWLREAIQKKMEVEFRGRLERGKPGAVRILNRVVTVTVRGLKYEAGQRHAEIIADELGLKVLRTGVKRPWVSDI